MQATGAVAMFGPAGMDPALTERISKAVRDALEDPEVKAKILKMGMQAKSSTPQELAAYDRAELERWRSRGASLGLRSGVSSPTITAAGTEFDHVISGTQKCCTNSCSSSRSHLAC